MVDLSDRTRIEEMHQAVIRAGGAEVDVDVLIASAAAALRTGQFEEARQILEGCIILDPDHPQAWAQAGIALEKLGKHADARVAYESAIGLDAHDLVTCLALAELYVRQGERSKAEALLGWILDEADEAPQIRQRSLVLRESLAKEGA